MKNLIIYFVIFIASITIANAQNPYSHFGCKAGVLQTEQEKSGEYNFVAIANDTNSEIQKIHFNLVDMEYIAFNVNGEIIKSGKIVIEKPKRWMSLDPLSSEFPDKSPYNFVSNDPINRIDPDGKADYYNAEGWYANDGIDDRERWSLKDGINELSLIKDGDYNYKSLKNNSFLFPDDQAIADFMTDAYDKAVIIAKPYNESGGVIASVPSLDETCNRQYDIYIHGGINTERPRSSYVKAEASLQVAKAKKIAEDSKIPIIYYIHTHPYGDSPSPSTGIESDISTSINTGIPGIIANNKGISFYDGVKISHMPISVFYTHTNYNKKCL